MGGDVRGSVESERARSGGWRWEGVAECACKLNDGHVCAMVMLMRVGVMWYLLLLVELLHHLIIFDIEVRAPVLYLCLHLG